MRSVLSDVSGRLGGVRGCKERKMANRGGKDVVIGVEGRERGCEREEGG